MFHMPRPSRKFYNQTMKGLRKEGLSAGLQSPSGSYNYAYLILYLVKFKFKFIFAIINEIISVKRFN